MLKDAILSLIAGIICSICLVLIKDDLTAAKYIIAKILLHFIYFMSGISFGRYLEEKHNGNK